MPSCSPRLQRGELATPAGVEKQVRRMLADPRAHESLDEFVSQWLRFDRLTTASKDRRKFPYFTRETANAMIDGGAHVRLRPGLERWQLHGSFYGRLRLRQPGTGAHLWRTGAGQGFRPGAVSSGL